MFLLLANYLSIYLYIIFFFSLLFLIFIFQERKRQDRLRAELASELSNKDLILQDLLSKHSELEQRLTEINGQDTDIKLRNAKLEKVKSTIQTRRSFEII